MRILAIDPGFDRLGIAVVEGDASKPTLVWGECIVPPKGTKEQRLSVVKSSIEDAIKTYAPDILAIEKLFFSRNKTSALGVAEARGAVLSVAGAANLPVREYSPQQVKLAVTGYGAADKKAVGMMVPKLITLPEKKRLDDELDAIALGVAALSDRYPQS